MQITCICSRRGFTLVELLISIGLITLLIGILLPVVSKARKQANQTAALSNLRQIGVAMINYAAESRGRYPRHLPDDDEDGRAFRSLALLAARHKLPANLFIVPGGSDTPAELLDAEGWPAFATIDGVPVTDAVPTAIDAPTLARLQFHCSYAYDNDRKTGRRTASRVVLGDRADYAKGQSFSANWDGKGGCLLWTDGHGEFSRSKSSRDQSDPNLYHHNQFRSEDGTAPGEGATEVVDGVSVSATTLDTHLRFFSEEEDDALLPNP